MTEVESYPFLKGTVVVFSSRCPGVTRTNEDSAAVLPSSGSTGVLAVADGVGGQAAGEQASALSMDILKDCLLHGKEAGIPIRESILNAFEMANEQITALGTGAGTTVAAVEIDKDKVRSYHIGDSAILIFGQKGKFKFQSVSHSPVGYAQEAGVITEEEAITHDDRHLVSNIIGTSDMYIEVGTHFSLASNDTVLIASDGLYDNMTVQEIIDHCRSGDLSESIQALAKETQQRMSTPLGKHPSKPDDLTIVAFRLS